MRLRGQLVVARVDRQLEALDALGVELASSSAVIASANSPVSVLASAASASMPAASISAMWRSAAGSSIVRAIIAAVSASMLAPIVYCSDQTSKRDSSSRCESTSYFSNAWTV